MSSSLEHLRAAATELEDAAASLGRADSISAAEWPAVAQALLAIRRALANLDRRLEGK
jgi:hypothetical protein